MRMTFHVIGLIFLLIVSGCASKIEILGVDSKKAAAANTQLGVAYLAQGKYKIAMVKLKKALSYDDENANAHHYIAELYRRLKQIDLANEHFQTALDLNDEDSAIKNNYGIFLCGSGSFKEGLKLLNKALADPLYDDKGQVYENMGLCAEKQGNILIAEKHFVSALKFNKNAPSALLGLAQIAFDKKNIKAAMAYLKTYNKVARYTPQSLWLEVLIARSKGYKGRAGSLAIKLKQYFPDSKEASLLKKLKLR
jgi:type IV pilus assembly protein PilF